MSRAAALAALLLAGCNGGAPAPTPTTERTEAAAALPAPAPPAAATGRQLGSSSTLSAMTSPLTGVVSGFAVERTATETRVLLAADTLFDFDKATLTPAAETNLARTAALVAEGGKGAVTVVGHTDAKGDDAYNDSLSRRRADAVAAWLRARPELAGRGFTPEGRGEREPVAPNAAPDGGDDPAGRARNRRVEVVIPN